MMCKCLDSDTKKKLKMGDSKNFSFLNKVSDEIDMKEDFDMVLHCSCLPLCDVALMLARWWKPWS